MEGGVNRSEEVWNDLQSKVAFASSAKQDVAGERGGLGRSGVEVNQGAGELSQG